jgi:CDP-6-deoxy-D-xylo-4-hexulose-3-dehydrase
MRVYVIEALTHTDISMNQTLWVGLYPGLNNDHLDFTVQKLEEFFGVNF